MLRVFVYAMILLSTFVSPVAAQNSAIKSILGGEVRNGFEPNDTNIKKAGTIQKIQIEGRNAVRVLVRYEDEGGALDWRRLGKPGHAQRIQFHERRPRYAMKLDRDYWYAISFFIEPFPASSRQFVEVFDIKPVYKQNTGRTHPGSPIFGIHVVNGDFVFYDSIGVQYDCGEYRNANGSYNLACDRQINRATLGSQSSYTGRWVDVLIHARWSNDSGGTFRYWVDGVNRFVFNGNTAREAHSFEFKFGPYRHHMNGPQPPLAISYSNVTRSDSCEGLGIPNCAQIQAGASKLGRRNVQRLSSGLFAEFSELTRSGSGG